MPSEVSKGSPLPVVTPPRLQSPSKPQLNKDPITKLDNDLTEAEVDRGTPKFVTQLNEPSKESGQPSLVVDTPRRLEDVELVDKENPLFLTETNLRELGAIDEEEFEDEDLPVEDSQSTCDDRSSVGSRERVRTGTRTRTRSNTTLKDVSPPSEMDEIDGEYDTDLEMDDSEKWLHPELFDRDTTGMNRYIRMCEKLDIQPITYFLKHMQDKQLVMKYHGLGPLGVKAMSDPLEVNTSIEKMDIEGNFILGVGAVYLAKVLKDNVYVTELILSENRMGNKGAEAICDLLLENKTITHLDLKGNNIEDGVAENFYDMLSKNTDLRTLILRHNSFEDVGARQLKDALVENDTLTSLDLSWNHFQWRGCCMLAEGLQENQGLKRINLCMNGFGLEGAKSLEEALRCNHTLQELDISYCRITLEGAPHIAAGLQNNDTLEHLNIGYNPVQGEGGYVILVAADRNEHGCIHRINFGNLMVKKDFEQLADELTEKPRQMEILYGGVMLDVTSFRNRFFDPWAAHINDPMTKLKEWLVKAGYRLVDLLLTFDRTKTLTVDLDELKMGIHGAGIEMTDIEIELLMKKLDTDNSGAIDMSELMAGAEAHTQSEREAIVAKQEMDKVSERRKSLALTGDPDDFKQIIKETGPTKIVARV